MRSLLAVSICVAALLGSELRTAQACSCVHPGYEMLSPSPATTAPRNARVRVAFASSWGHSVTVILRGPGGLTLPTHSTLIQGGQQFVVELRSVQPLPANSSLEVIAIEGGAATVVGRFETGRVLDNRSPTWRGVSRALLIDPRRRDKRSATSRAARRCSKATPYAVLRGAAARDNDTTSTEMLYAVWLADRRGHFDTSLPPLALVPMRRGRLWLGSRSACDRVQLRFPKGRVRLAVAAVDAAGNRSRARLVQLRR